MIRYYCDRCKKEIDPDSAYYIVSTDIFGVDRDGLQDFCDENELEYHLCPECYANFKEWFDFYRYV